MVRRPPSRTKLSIVVFFVLTLVLICFMFPCKNCHEEFRALSAKGLKQHQKRCQTYLTHESAANARRKATVASKNVRRTKLKERKVRVGSLPATAGPEVSFS